MTYFLLALQLLPAIIAAVKALEREIPISGAGKEKLDLIVGVAEAVFETAPSDVSNLNRESLIKTIISMVGRIVSVLNTLGVFTKK